MKWKSSDSKGDQNARQGRAYTGFGLHSQRWIEGDKKPIVVIGGHLLYCFSNSQSSIYVLNQIETFEPPRFLIHAPNLF